MGIAPFWGFQMMIVVVLCRLFKLNTAIALISSNISIPPFLPFILYYSYKTGNLVLQNESIKMHQLSDLNLSMVNTLGYTYIVGAFVLSIVVALIGGFTSWIIFKLITPKFPSGT